jgi:hypothetical protein
VNKRCANVAPMRAARVNVVAAVDLNGASLTEHAPRARTRGGPGLDARDTRRPRIDRARVRASTSQDPSRDVPPFPSEKRSRRAAFHVASSFSFRSIPGG